MRELTYTQRLADTIHQFGGATAYQASAELLRLEARVAELESQELAAFEVIDQHGKSALFLDRERATDYAAQHKAVARFELVRRKL